MNSKRGIAGIFILFVLAILSACGGGSSSPGRPAAAITTQPTDQSVVSGTTATFMVAASNATGYQWQISIDGGSTFSDIAGATAAGYSTAIAVPADSGTRYRVVVTGAGNSVTSSAVTLTVTAAPIAPGISVHPANQTVTEGQDASFSVTASGTSLSYQWQRSTDGGGSFTDVAAATGATLNLTAAPLSSSGYQFQVLVSNVTGSITSNPATLTVNAAVAPAFTTQPADVTVTEGQNAQFTAAATGTPAPTLQWQVSANSGGSWSDIVGETGAAYTAVNPALADNGRQFRAVATNSAGAVPSSAAVLTVTAPVAVTITSLSPLPAGITNVPYSVSLTASGGTPPFTWSVADGYTLPSFLSLNASTGEISGTPTIEAMYGWAIKVTDSANPQQTDQKYFDLAIAAPCDIGLGSLTVAGAPNTVEGKFCPQTAIAPGTPNGAGMVTAAWTETYPYGGGSYRESVGVSFYPATGQIESVQFFLNDPTRMWTYLCVPAATVDYPACAGVTVNTGTGLVTFINTVVGSGTSTPFTLNGSLIY